MAEPLKNQFGPSIPTKIAAMITQVHANFPYKTFIKEALTHYEALDLMARGRKIAHALHHHLPSDYNKAVAILINSLGPEDEFADGAGGTLAPFIYLPHVMYVAEFGLDYFSQSMQAQYELTKRFTAEFSIRGYLSRYPSATLKQLQQWVTDPNVHVRRLVSEGTRPRLPWAPQLRQFRIDPSPVVRLLEQLKDDGELYVRRSVANNLNDIGKDHLDVLVTITKKWSKDATPERQWLVRHALRSAIKRGEPKALAVLGYTPNKFLLVQNPKIAPQRVHIGETVVINFEVVNSSTSVQTALIDFAVHFVKANGTTNAKVFKLKEISLAAQSSIPIRKSISLKQLTTRVHYPGVHPVTVHINGVIWAAGEFVLVAQKNKK